MPESPKLRAYFAPGACSRVMLHALETIGLQYESNALALLRGEQKQPAYLAINPKGKVPALDVDGDLLTENAAIAWYLANRFREAELLPHLDDPIRSTQVLADLIWCSGTLHPMIRRMMRPTLFNEEAPDNTHALGLAELHKTAKDLDARLDGQDWWYGDKWSLVDTYMAWALWIGVLRGFPIDEYPNLSRHARQLSEMASFQRVLAVEKDAVARNDIPLPAGATL